MSPGLVMAFSPCKLTGAARWTEILNETSEPVTPRLSSINRISIIVFSSSESVLRRFNRIPGLLLGGRRLRGVSVQACRHLFGRPANWITRLFLVRHSGNLAPCSQYLAQQKQVCEQGTKMT
jgi:hypothetical protein